MPRLPLGEWVDSAVTFLQNHLSWLFDAITKVVNGMYDGIDAVLSAPHPLLFAGILAVVAWWLRGLVAGVLAFGGFALIDSIELWDEAMSTLSLVLVATVVTLLLAVPLGIWSSRSKTVSAISRPVLDFMQTMPAMVYLIPGIIFFGVGVVPGIIATIVFSLPPGVRMTELGIRQVDPELVEAAEAFGTTRATHCSGSSSRWRCPPSWRASTRSSCWACPWSSSRAWSAAAASAARSTGPSATSTSASASRRASPSSCWPCTSTG